MSIENQIEVDAIFDIKEPRDIREAVEDIDLNGYQSHKILYRDLILVETTNGTIAVRMSNPTYGYGILVGLARIKHKELIH